MKIARIELQYRYDTDPDYSHLGEYTDEVSPGVIDRSTGEFLRWEFGEPVNVPARGREYRFFKPCAGGEKPGTKNYYKYGRHDYARIVGLEREDWQYIGIMAAATVLYEMANGLRRLETFTSGGLWGVESDCAEHCKAMANEEIEDLREHLSQFGITVSDQDWQTLTEDLDPVWKYTITKEDQVMTGKKRPQTFYCGGKIRDWNTGNEFHDHRAVDNGKSISCWVNGVIFRTWIDAYGERNWRIA